MKSIEEDMPKQELKKVRYLCTCECNTNPNIIHMKACCNNGYKKTFAGADEKVIMSNGENIW